MNTETYRNGCHNRKPFVEDVLVQTGSNDIPAAHGATEALRFAVVKPVPFRMARDCQYTKTTLGQADKGCTGCKWKAVP